MADAVRQLPNHTQRIGATAQSPSPPQTYTDKKFFGIRDLGRNKYGKSARHRQIVYPVALKPENFRSTRRRACRVRIDEAVLTEVIVALATEHGRYVYRRITMVLTLETGPGGAQVFRAL
ncbi:hypothetical protein E2C06_23215 [Dankookia rubra]|uniref:Uncharacterized protein n=1 Tax=Dankookia rubra TaxID=1442381 RepID=A0A4R5QCT0_9PROT|nr:hypothetical protein E2C06_23215 [Dankookia rubra]